MAIIIANLFVLLALAALLLDCRFPCDWTNSTIVSLESRLRSVHLTSASLRGSFYSIVLQEFSKIVCSWNFQVFCGATSSSSSITHASFLPACSGGAPASILSLLRGPRRRSTSQGESKFSLPGSWIPRLGKHLSDPV